MKKPIKTKKPTFEEEIQLIVKSHKKNSSLRRYSILFIAFFGFIALAGISTGDRIIQKAAAEAYSVGICNTAGNKGSGNSTWTVVMNGTVPNVTITGTDTIWDNTLGGLSGIYDTTQIRCGDIIIPAGKKLTVFPHSTVNTKKVLQVDGNLCVGGSGAGCTSPGNGILVLEARGKNTASSGYGMEVDVTGNVTVNSGGTVSVDGKGYLSNGGQGWGPGGGEPLPHARGAGGYGGEGGGKFPGSIYGNVYGLVNDPNDLGSGAGGDDDPATGAGGGLVRILAGGAFTNNGSISANGQSGASFGAGGGSGGGIKIVADTIGGTGTILANGGGGISGGGGGRIALIYKTSYIYAGLLQDAVLIQAKGVNSPTILPSGGAGTVFKAKTTAIQSGTLSQKELLVSNDGSIDFGSYTDGDSSYDANIGKTFILGDTYRTISIKNRSNVVFSSGNTIIDGVSDAGIFTVYDSKFTNSINLSSVDAGDSIVMSDGARIYNSSSGIFNINSASNTTFSGKNTYFENQNDIEQLLGNLFIQNSAELSHKSNDDIHCLGIGSPYSDGGLCGPEGNFKKNYTLKINITNVTIDSGGRIDVAGKGYGSAGVSYGYGPGGGDGGSGYRGGGYGGETRFNPLSTYGNAYGSTSDPNDLGSGGSDGTLVGTGGGIIRITASDTIKNQSIISANGNNAGGNEGGGAGGSIKLITDKIIGAGSISAKGGSTSEIVGGAAGGRIAIIYKNADYSLAKSFYGPVSAVAGVSAGGVFDGGAGTVFFAKTDTIPLGTLSNKELVISGINTDLGAVPDLVPPANPPTTVYNNYGTKIAKTPLSADRYRNVTIKNRANAVMTSGTLIIDGNGTNGNLEVDNSKLTNQGTIQTTGASDGLLFKSAARVFSYNINTANMAASVVIDGTDTYFESQSNLIQNFGNLFIQNGAVLSHKENDNITCHRTPNCASTPNVPAGTGTHFIQSYTLRINAQNILVGSGSAINTNGKGYVGIVGVGNGPGGGEGGVSETQWPAGGGYGGTGGNGGWGAGAGGPIYGSSSSDPNDLGSAGGGGVYVGHGNAYFGGNGGGLIKITLSAGGSLINNGAISANCGNPNPGGYSGAGSGGTVNIYADNILGNGTFTANGGTGEPSAGGGGKIALSKSTYANRNIINTNITASGTPTYSGDGILYDKTSVGLKANTANSGYFDIGSITNSAETKLLVHNDGVNGSQTFYDSSVSNHALTANGDVKISTAQSVSGGSSAYFDGSGDYITSPASSDFVFGSGAFSIEAWVYPTRPGGMGAVNGYEGIINTFTGAGGSDGWALSSYEYGSTIGFWDGGVGSLAWFNTGVPFTMNAWQHIAVTRTPTGTSNNLKIYKDGVVILTATDNHVINATFPLRIGRNLGGWSDYMGYMDEIRVIKGVALDYTNNTNQASQASKKYIYVDEGQTSPDTIPLVITAKRPLDGQIDNTFNSSVTISMNNSISGQFMFSGATCTGGSGTCSGGTYSSPSTTVILDGTRFVNGIAQINVSIKDLRDGYPTPSAGNYFKHHGFTPFTITTSASSYSMSQDGFGSSIELEDGTPTEILKTSGTVPSGDQLAYISYPTQIGFRFGPFATPLASDPLYKKDMGGTIVIRKTDSQVNYQASPPAPQTPVPTLAGTSNRNNMYKVGDYININGSIYPPTTLPYLPPPYKVVCVTRIEYGASKFYCKDGDTLTNNKYYTYSAYSYNRTYDFFTQNEASNYSAATSIVALTGAAPGAKLFTATPQTNSIQLDWQNPEGVEGQTKTIITKQQCGPSGAGCNTTFTPTQGNDYDVGSSTGVVGLSIIYANSNIAQLTQNDLNVTTGTWYTYKIYIQYTDSNGVVYYSGPVAADAKINIQPEVMFKTGAIYQPTQTLGTDNVIFTFRMRDQDANPTTPRMANTTLSLVGAPGSPSCNITSSLTGGMTTNPKSNIVIYAPSAPPTTNTTWVDVAVTWNAKTGGCAGLERAISDNFKIRVTVDDGSSNNNTASIDSDPFILDTLAPTIPGDPILTSLSSSSIKVKPGAIATDGYLYPAAHLPTFDTKTASYIIYGRKGGAIATTDIDTAYPPASSFPPKDPAALPTADFLSPGTTNPAKFKVLAYQDQLTNKYDPTAEYTITGLDGGSQYSFITCLHDQYGHRSCSGSPVVSTLTEALSLTISGLGTGTLPGPYNDPINMSSTGSMFNFNPLNRNDDRIAGAVTSAVQLVGQSNYSGGFNVTMSVDHPLQKCTDTSCTAYANPVQVINNATASYGAPLLWSNPSVCPVGAKNCLAYAATDISNFGTDSTNRKWSYFDLTPQYIMSYNAPGSKTSYLLSRIWVSNNDDPLTGGAVGSYKNTITFRITAVP